MTKETVLKQFFLYPTLGRIVVQEDGFKYGGQILIPETAKRRPTTGTIMAVGEDIEPSRFKVGDKVVYGLYSGTVLSFKGQPAFRVLNQDEILAIVEGEPELEGSGT
jgi:co-chaperonin GroES (HSP10)